MTMARPLVNPEQVAAFQADGVICVWGAFGGWVERLQQGVAHNLAEPGPHATENTQPGEGGRFFDDYCNWQRIDAYRKFVFESPAAELAAQVMRSGTAQFFHEHVLIKEPGTGKATPWHQDQPYYCVDGLQTVSMWIALDPVPRSSCPQFVVGSHHWPKMIKPQHWLDDSDFYGTNVAWMALPDIDRNRADYTIAAWDLAPGDAVLFSYRTVHGAPGNASPTRRAGFSARWVGDDVRFAERPGRTSPPFPGIGLSHGDRLREDWFPVVWRGGAPNRDYD